VFFDFAHAIAASSLSERASKVAGGLVTGLRFGRHANGTTRVVLELTGSPRYSSYPLYNPFRVVIDVESSGPPPTPPSDVPPGAGAKPPASPPPAPRPSANAAAPDRDRPAREETRPVPPPIPATAPALPVSAPPATPPPPSPAPAATTAKGDYSLSRQLGLGVSRIVIDPGHGGHDPGARANGLNEADVVLDIAQRVATLLREHRGIEVVLTRETNVFIPLEERTAIANRAGPADLFVSIHANASRNTTASGIETYVLNFASNPAAEEVAARENATSGRTMGTLPDLIQAIALNDKLQESRELATMVQTSLIRSLRTPTNNVRDLGVKQAPFVVLIGAQMPSVLAEVSFLTNRAEANQLKQPAYRQRIAQALHDAIIKYQASLRRITTN
jgi:N-acetylmuramoyl-L-alanine amidase